MKVLKSGCLMPSEQVRRVHCVTPEADTTLEEMLAPEYWRAVTQSMRPGDIIEVSAEDGSFYADLRVWDVGMSWAKVRMHHISHHQPNDNTVVDWMTAYTLGRNPTGPGLLIRRISDNAPAGQFPDRETAIEWMQNTLRG